ncbi:hypothetical protein EV421DRAFT_1733387 [Armillaria borealis]|uniref:Uncharacterized protein n=1 Tax=Armillaria borealis TaxID=47425 RepID=A0AA39JS75_9AGAR|nr:hypothetical protein EV421DRAFT_1733387 [Armillaria borealis]
MAGADVMVGRNFIHSVSKPKRTPHQTNASLSRSRRRDNACVENANAHTQVQTQNSTCPKTSLPVSGSITAELKEGLNGSYEAAFSLLKSYVVKRFGSMQVSDTSRDCLVYLSSGIGLVISMTIPILAQFLSSAAMVLRWTPGTESPYSVPAGIFSPFFTVFDDDDENRIHKLGQNEEHWTDSQGFSSGEIVAKVLKEEREKTHFNKGQNKKWHATNTFVASVSSSIPWNNASLGQASGELRLNVRKFDREMNDTASVPPWHDIRGLGIWRTCGMALRGTV